MKVAFLLATADAVGGTELVTQAYARELARSDDVTVLSVYRTVEAPPEPGHVFLIDTTGASPVPMVDLHLSTEEAGRLATRPSDVVDPEWDSQFSLLSDVALEHALAAHPYDLVVTTSPALLALAIRFKHMATRVFHQEHRASEFRVASLPPLLRFGPQAQGVGFLTEASRTAFRSQWGEGAPPMVVLPNPVSDTFRPRASLREPVVVMAARLTPEKQLDHAIWAFSQASRRVPGWQLRIFGEGPMRRRLRRLVHALHVEDDVLLLGATKNMELEWARASIALLTSKYEGFSLALAEAQCAGLPIISYDCPNGPRAIVTPGVDGELVPAGDRAALAQALVTYMQDGALRRRAGEAAHQQTQKYGLDVAAPRLRQALLAAAGDTRHPWARVARAGAPGAPAADCTDDMLVLRPDELPWQVRDRNAEACAAQLDAAGVDFLAARSHRWSRSRVIVSRHDVEKATAVLAEAGARWDELEDGGGSAVVSWQYDHPTLRRVLGSDYGVLVEPWEPDGEGAWVKPGSDRSVSVRPSDTTVALPFPSRSRRSAPSLARCSMNQVTFPVDVVYTWVDGDDEDWRRRREAHGEPSARMEDERFRQLDELRYSLRSLSYFAPWVRHVYIVTDGQVPSWLDVSQARVTLVDHRDIAPFPGALPVYNSHAIEAWLHRIEGLSEHFIYMNDDVFLGRPVDPELFFTAGGLCRVAPSPTLIPDADTSAAALPHFAAARNGVDLLLARFGQAPDHTFLHTPHPLKRSVLAEIEQAFPDVWRVTATSRWRSRQDLSIASFFHHAYALATGQAVPGPITSVFVNPAMLEQLPRLLSLSPDRYDSICINDFGEGDIDYAGRASMIAQFMRRHFPMASPFETGATSLLPELPEPKIGSCRPRPF